MTIPLIVLAAGALLGGLFDLPASAKLQFLNHWLEPSLPGELPLHLSTLTKWWLEIVVTVLVFIGIGLASYIYLGLKRERQRRYEPEILAKSWYYDIAVSAFVAGPGMAFYNWVTNWFDRYIIDGAVNGAGWIARTAGQGVRRWQTGYLRSYGLTIAAAVVVLLAFVLVRANF
jgi:NADH-quinone oxidoreductase subunit L